MHRFLVLIRGLHLDSGSGKKHAEQVMKLEESASEVVAKLSSVHSFVIQTSSYVQTTREVISQKHQRSETKLNAILANQCCCAIM